MKKLLIALSALVSVMALSCFNANASLISGDGLILLSAPSSVADDSPGATNTAMQGFDEAQGVLLGADLAVDGGAILAGTTVDSHMIFLNTAGNKYAASKGFEWIFDGDILGVMSKFDGSLEANSNTLLGAAGTNYPRFGFRARGLENNDSYSFLGDTLTVSMIVSEPGDWIRVVTASTAPVPEPATMVIFGAGLLGLVGFARRKKK